MSDTDNKKKKWTLMFYFASDNTLSPSMLYQFKAIKTAGYQVDTNVLVHFDPHERGIPSMIFEVNRTEKEGRRKSQIGDDRDPRVRDLAGDQVEPKLNGDEHQVQKSRSSDTDKLTAAEELRHFLDFSREQYPADKYMLFLVGHGLVVGRDAFLPDDNPGTGISLVELENILRSFSREVGKDALELVGMHSCSMSAVEVAYQLKDTARYMMASEGLSFVGAWPYRQMLQKIFSTIDKPHKPGDEWIADLMKRLHELCLHNSADFIFAGYSSDLCLCSLEKKRVEALSGPITNLSKALKAGLKDSRCNDVIQLAHLESQSYFQELYTDLGDFCECLKAKCKGSDANAAQKEIHRACESVTRVLSTKRGPIVQADFFGPDCQYSHGLSIYFPWARPVEDASEHFIRNYETYAFVTELGNDSWLDFLEVYFEETERDKRETRIPNELKETLKRATAMFKPMAFRTGAPATPVTALTGGKTSPADASGDFSYSFIKNYSRDFAITARALRVFEEDEKGQKKNNKSKNKK
jgi:hypothetical protein